LKEKKRERPILFLGGREVGGKMAVGKDTCRKKKRLFEKRFLA